MKNTVFRSIVQLIAISTLCVVGYTSSISTGSGGGGSDAPWGTSVTDNGTVGATATINWTTSRLQKITLGSGAAPCVLTFTAPTYPGPVLLYVVQDGTGGRKVTWPASVLSSNGVASLAISSAASAKDVYSLQWDGTNYWAGLSVINGSH